MNATTFFCLCGPPCISWSSRENHYPGPVGRIQPALSSEHPARALLGGRHAVPPDRRGGVDGGGVARLPGGHRRESAARDGRAVLPGVWASVRRRLASELAPDGGGVIRGG